MWWVGVELRLRADVRSSSQMCGVAFLDLSSLSLPFSSRGGERDRETTWVYHLLCVVVHNISTFSGACCKNLLVAHTHFFPPDLRIVV